MNMNLKLYGPREQRRPLFEKCSKQTFCVIVERQKFSVHTRQLNVCVCYNTQKYFFSLDDKNTKNRLWIYNFWPHKRNLFLFFLMVMVSCEATRMVIIIHQLVSSRFYLFFVSVWRPCSKIESNCRLTDVRS